MIDPVPFLRQKEEEVRQLADVTPDLMAALRRLADELSREAAALEQETRRRA